MEIKKGTSVSTTSGRINRGSPLKSPPKHSIICPQPPPLRSMDMVAMWLLVICCASLWMVAAEGAVPTVAVGNISKVEDSQYFRIFYGQSFKVVKNSIDGKSYLLIQNTSRMASRTKYCTGRIKSFVIPLSNYSVDATFFPVAFLELLGMLDGMKAVTSEEVASDCAVKSISSGSITLVNRTDTKQLQQFPAHFVDTAESAQQSCNFIAFAPLKEINPLQRAEWIKFLGALANLEVRANDVYNTIKANYNCLSKVASNYTSRIKPVVAWVEYNQGIWSFAKEEYKKQFVMDAGGENLDDTITNNSYNVSGSDDMENFHAILCMVDVVIDQTYTAEPAEYTMSMFLANVNMEDTSCFSFLANQSLWRYDKRMTSSKALDWSDVGVAQPQLVLADLMEMLFPTGNHNTTIFRNIAKGEALEITGPDKCERSNTTPLQPTVVPCQLP